MDGSISPLEVATLRRCADLVRVWGYRQGPHEQHTAYEHEMHTHELRPAQEITDIVFRNIQQICFYEYVVLFSMDTETKMRRVLSFDPAAIATNAELRRLLARYLREPGSPNERMSIRQRMQWLADRPLDAHSSLGFSIIVKSAEALLMIARGRGHAAIDMLRSFFGDI